MTGLAIIAAFAFAGFAMREGYFWPSIIVAVLAATATIDMAGR